MLDVFFVVHSEEQRLCANVRPHRDRRRERVLVDSTSELLPWLPSTVHEGMAGGGTSSLSASPARV